MTDTLTTRRRQLISPRVLPYVLSLPALLVCIGILVPFVTAIYYSLQRYRMSQPWNRGMNWGEPELKVEILVVAAARPRVDERGR